MLKKKVLFLYEKEDTDRIKLLVLFCGEDDLLLNIAASSALDLLSRNSKKICQKILKVSSFIATFKDCIMSDDVEFQLKSLTVLKNIVVKGKFFSDDLMNSKLKETIVALSQDEVDNEREMVFLFSKTFFLILNLIQYFFSRLKSSR